MLKKNYFKSPKDGFIYVNMPFTKQHVKPMTKLVRCKTITKTTYYIINTTKPS